MQILNRHHLKRGDYAKYPDLRYIGRGTPYGNRFEVGVHGTREECVALYNAELPSRYGHDPVLTVALRALREETDLLCSCTPAACHGDGIEQFWQTHVQPFRYPRSMRYAGIGSRKTPPLASFLMTFVAELFSSWGLELQSGAADGADSAFEAGAFGKKRIWLPKNGFNERHALPDGSVISEPYPSPEALKLAEWLHPAWYALTPFARKAMGRNCHQILGKDLLTENVDFVLCWTPDGCESVKTRSQATGGTGQAIGLASHLYIPVFNLKNADAMRRCFSWLQEHPELGSKAREFQDSVFRLVNRYTRLPNGRISPLADYEFDQLKRVAAVFVDLDQLEGRHIEPDISKQVTERAWAFQDQPTAAALNELVANSMVLKDPCILGIWPELHKEPLLQFSWFLSLAKPLLTGPLTQQEQLTLAKLKCAYQLIRSGQL